MIAEQVKGSIIVEMAKNAIGAFCLSVAIANERYFRRSERRLWIGGSLALPFGLNHEWTRMKTNTARWI